MVGQATRRWWALGATALAVMAVGLDATVLNLALPTLARELRASSDELQWFVASYALALAAGMLPGGLLGDRYGRKRLFLLALTAFGLGSVGCAFAPSPAALIAARTALGVSAAFLVTMSLSLITVLFSEGERPRAIGVWAAANFLALPLGPILGGWLLTNFWWGWVFLINVPVVALGLAAVTLVVPESLSERRPGLDPIGVVSSSSGLAALTYGLITAGQAGWTDAHAVLFMAIGVALVVAFVLWERRLGARPDGQPLVDVSLFGSRRFTWGTLLAGLGIVGMFGALFAIPQYLQGVRGLDAQGAGFRLLPMIAGIVVGAAPADRLVGQIGAKLTVALGFVMLAAATAVGSLTTMASGDIFTALWVFGCGAGMGIVLSTAASAALSELSAERSGVGSALMQAVQKMGGPFGVAVMGSILVAAYRSHLDQAGLAPIQAAAAQKSVFAGIALAQQAGSAPLLASVREAFVAGMDAMLLASAGVAIAGAALALVFMPGRSTAREKDVDGPELQHVA